MAEENQDGFFRRIFEESPGAILVVTLDFHIADANPAAERMFNRRLADLRNSELREFVAHLEQTAFAAIVADIEEQKGCVARPLLLRLPDETHCEVALTAAVVLDGAGVPEFILVTLLERGKSISEDFL